MNHRLPYEPAMDIPSALTSDECAALFKWACALRRDSPHAPIVEIGTAQGRSALVMAHAPGGFVVCVDDWGEHVNYRGQRFHHSFERFERNLDRLGMRDRVSIRRGLSVDVAVRWPPAVGIAMLFIDGDHSQKGVQDDWMAWSPHLKPGAIVAFHDYTLPGAGVRNMVDGLVMGGDLSHIELVDSLAITSFRE